MKAFSISSIAAAGLAVSISASAERRVAWHWESWGSSGDPGGVTYYVKIDAQYDDGLGVIPPIRYPNTGTRGLGSTITTNGKIDGVGTPGKGCTLTTNSKGVKGLIPGVRNWQAFISPTLDAINQAGFRMAIAAVNIDQEKRGRSFRIVEVPYESFARMVITEDKPEISKSADAATAVYITRDGSIERSWTVADPTTNLDYATARAGHELGYALGLDVLKTIDPNYPSQMSEAMAAINPKQGLDLCTAAAIDANVNRGKN
jgi:hypothetical protein